MCFKGLEVLTQTGFQHSSGVSEKTLVLIKCVPLFFRSYSEGKSGLWHMKKIPEVGGTYKQWEEEMKKEDFGKWEQWSTKK